MTWMDEILAPSSCIRPTPTRFSRHQNSRAKKTTDEEAPQDLNAPFRRSPPLSLDPWAHPPAQPIDPSLISSPKDFWALVKQIDGLGGEWTYDIFMIRALNFHQHFVAPYYYEPLGSFDALALEALLRQRADHAGVPLDEQGNVSLSMQVFASIFDSRDGRISLPEAGERMVGRHCVNILGLENADSLVFRLAWSGWAKGNGIGYLSREYMERFATGCWVGRRWDRGPASHDAAELVLASADGSEIVRLWREWRTSGRRSGDHPGLSLHWHTTRSIASDCQAEVLVLAFRGADPRVVVRAGVAVLLLMDDVGKKVSTLTDLYIWPTYRRRGYGVLLERFAAERAAGAGSKRLAVCVWDADCATGKTGATAFLDNLGYAVESYPGAQMVARGIRDLV